MKSEDEFARAPGEPEITEEESTSYLSGRTNQELAAEGGLRADHAARSPRCGSASACFRRRQDQRRAQRSAADLFGTDSREQLRQAASGPKWIHEIKHDGYRMQARIDGRTVKLLTRKALDWTERFRAIADALKELQLGSTLIDGEIIVEDTGGISNFSNLQADLQSGRQERMRYYAFDLYYCEGFDLTQATLLDRKDCCSRLSPVFRRLADPLQRASRDRRTADAGAFLPLGARRHHLQAQGRSLQAGPG